LPIKLTKKRHFKYLSRETTKEARSRRGIAQRKRKAKSGTRRKDEKEAERIFSESHDAGVERGLRREDIK